MLAKSKGNMYPWVTHTHTHLGGECSHKCGYCYVNSFRHRVEKYQGALRLIDKELALNYGKGKTVFIEHCNDLFAEDVPTTFITQILEHCRQYPRNTYVFQTKNPARLPVWLEDIPTLSIIGTTIETNRIIDCAEKAPCTAERSIAIRELDWPRKFVTIEPVMDFDVDILAQWIAEINPQFLNLGADSKNNDLPEPTVEKIHQLVAKLAEYGIELREKHNLARLKP